MEVRKTIKRSCTSRLSGGTDADEQDLPATKRINNQNSVEPPIDINKRCFMCYKTTEDNKCSTCDRHFHLKCLNRSGLPVNWKCYGCLRIKETRHPSQIDYNLSEMLEIFEKMLKFDERLMKLKQLREDDIVELNELFNEKIKKRIEQFQYESVGQFLNSMDNLIYEIVKKLADKKLVPLGKLKDWADSVKNNCADEISLIESCSKCFVNKSKDPINWFTDVCDSRHRVVWAKIQQSYWPAKVLKEEDKWFTVQFFDGHLINKIIHKNIINYADDNPNEAMADEDLRLLNNSIKDVKQYLEKLDKGTTPSEFSNSRKIVFNRFHNSFMANYQSVVRDIENNVCAESKSLQAQLKKVTEEKDRLSHTNNNLNGSLAMLLSEIDRLNGQNIQLIADKNQLVEQNNQLVAQKVQFTDRISEMEKNNEQLTKASIKAYIEKNELNERIDRQKILMEEVSAKLAAKEIEEENERKKLQESIIELFEKKKN